jgi:hypothetical protein
MGQRHPWDQLVRSRRWDQLDRSRLGYPRGHWGLRDRYCLRGRLDHSDRAVRWGRQDPMGQKDRAHRKRHWDPTGHWNHARPKGHSDLTAQ